MDSSTANILVLLLCRLLIRQHHCYVRRIHRTQPKFKHFQQKERKQQ